jgi:hypothetical protein
MKERNSFFEKITNTKTMNRREQVVFSRLRTGYIKATHPSTECPFCAVKITIEGNRNKTATNEHHLRDLERRQRETATTYNT